MDEDEVLNTRKIVFMGNLREQLHEVYVTESSLDQMGSARVKHRP